MWPVEMIERGMVDTDFDGLTDLEILVLLIVDGMAPVSKTRLQRLSLLYFELYVAGEDEADLCAHFFAGYSDEIDESAVNLIKMGIVDSGRSYYVLTEYGRRLRGYILDELGNIRLIERIKNIKNAVSLISDRKLVGLTHHFYGDVARNMAIGQSVDRLNTQSSYDGMSLMDYPKETFESKLIDGVPIRSG